MTENIKRIVSDESFEAHLKKLSEAAAAVRKHRDECRARGVEPSESYAREILMSVGVSI